MGTEPLDARYWHQRYTDDLSPWDLGAPSTPLATYLNGLQDRDLRVLIPGAGRSYEAELAHQLGFHKVYPMDLTGAPLEDLMQRCPTFPREHLLIGDLFEHSGTYDLILEQTFFCALDPDQRPRYVEHMFHLLADGGKLMGVLFDQVPNTTGPPFGGSADEYHALFTPRFPGVSFTRCHNSIAPRAGRELWMRAIKDQSRNPIDRTG